VVRGRRVRQRDRRDCAVEAAERKGQPRWPESYTLCSYIIASTGAARYTLSASTGTVISDTENIEIEVITDTDGTIVISVTDASAAGTDTVYLGLQCGEYFTISPAITFA
jgi:hypothetical protein